MICWLNVTRGVDKADMEAILDEPVGGDQPCEIVPEYESVASHMDGATWRVNKDRNQIPEAMLRR